jgi:hypothetical protein
VEHIKNTKHKTQITDHNFVSSFGEKFVKSCTNYWFFTQITQHGAPLANLHQSQITKKSSIFQSLFNHAQHFVICHLGLWYISANERLFCDLCFVFFSIYVLAYRNMQHLKWIYFCNLCFVICVFRNAPVLWLHTQICVNMICVNTICDLHFWYAPRVHSNVTH